MVRSTSNTAHKNRLMILSNGSLHLYALSKGENWMKLDFSMIENREKWFESNTQLFCQISNFHTLLGQELASLRVRVRIPQGPQAKDEPLTIPVERFVSMLRFDSKEKLDDLGLELSL